MKNNYQYTLIKQAQIKICDQKDEEGYCLILRPETQRGLIEKYLCEDLIKNCSCSL